MNCLKRQEELVEIFLNLPTNEKKYQLIISLGAALPPLDAKHKIEANLVKGCQSKLYLGFEKEGDALFFYADSDALISKGLAAILIKIYNGETPENILKFPPTLMKDLDLISLLSLTRVNGFLEIFKKMQSIAIHSL